MQDPIYNNYFDNYEEELMSLMDGLKQFYVCTAINRYKIWAESDISAGIIVLNKGEMPLTIEEYFCNQINK